MSDNTQTKCTATGGIGLVTVILALIFLFVWPGPLRYEYHTPRPGSLSTIGIIKIDRITHQVSYFPTDKGRWSKL